MMYCLFCGAKLDDVEKVCSKCQKKVQTLMSIDDFKFVQVDPSLATAIEAKKGFFGGEVKKFARCVAEGKAFLAHVFLEETFTYRNENDKEYWCANIMDENRRPCESAVHLLSYDGIPGGDVVDGTSIDGEVVESVVLRYQIGKTTNYLLICKDCAEDLPRNAKDIVGHMRQDLRERSGPALEGSIQDRVTKGLGKLFGFDKE